jgi:hypothetical protein
MGSEEDIFVIREIWILRVQNPNFFTDRSFSELPGQFRKLCISRGKSVLDQVVRNVFPGKFLGLFP